MTIADIERWNSESVRDVFHAGTARAHATYDASRELSTLRVFDSWSGESADAAQHAIAKTHQDLDAHGREVAMVATAASRAADGTDKVQTELRQLKSDADSHGLEIDPDSNRIVPVPHSTHGRHEMQAAIPQLQARLDAIATEANTGSTPPPLTEQYRPFPADTSAKTVGTTEFYTPGKSWIGDIDPPLAQAQEEYRFRVAGQDVTTYTRIVNQGGGWQQQRWVQNVFESQKTTQVAFDGDIPVKGRTDRDGRGGGFSGAQTQGSLRLRHGSRNDQLQQAVR